MLRDFTIATVFLTRLPITLGGQLSMRDLAATVHFFPIIGALVGLGGGLLYLTLVWIGLPPTPAVILALVLMIGLTGALHEDGLADTADALGARGERTRALEIMRDSRIGSFGAIALILSLFLRVAALASLAAPAAVLAALVASAAVSRAAMPAVMLWQRSAHDPAARDAGLAAMSGRPPALRVAIGAGLAALLALLVIAPGDALTALLTSALAGGALALWLKRIFGGCTGDTLGAVQQVSEIAFLLALVARQ